GHGIGPRSVRIAYRTGGAMANAGGLPPLHAATGQHAGHADQQQQHCAVEEPQGPAGRSSHHAGIGDRRIH
nr:hypothetical protein [Tanacetum cinerariifolium]